MKYMTMDWWSGAVDRSTADAYGPYFQSIKDRLPPSVRRLHEDVSLHDSNLRLLVANWNHHTVEIQLDGYVWEPDKLPDAKQSILLRYFDVMSLTSTADPKTGLGGPHGYGDLGYDELELLDDLAVEHRMLFSTGIEIAIRFKNMSIDCKPID